MITFRRILVIVIVFFPLLYLLYRLVKWFLGRQPGQVAPPLFEEASAEAPAAEMPWEAPVAEAPSRSGCGRSSTCSRRSRSGARRSRA